MPLAGQAVRVHLLGDMELHGVAVYAAGRVSDRSHLVSPQVLKAVRSEINYKDDLTRRGLPDWWRELVPRIVAGAAGHLQRTFTPSRDGDVVLIEYGPRKGPLSTSIEPSPCPAPITI